MQGQKYESLKALEEMSCDGQNNMFQARVEMAQVTSGKGTILWEGIKFELQHVISNNVAFS